ncbi:MAG: hypothetical protein ABIH39_04800 [Candidatus Margulisiibacteriota bacterium]
MIDEKKCEHKNKDYLGVIDYRGYPEKLFICQDCGITISDYMTDDDLEEATMETEFNEIPEDDIFERFSDPYKHLHNEIL